MSKDDSFKRFFNSGNNQNGFRQKSTKVKKVDIIKPRKMNASRTSN